MKRKFSKVKMVILDFDGVLTDNLVSVDENGRESVTCSRSDGLGIEMIKKAGIHVAVISKETNKVVSARCRKLGIECHQSVEGKLPKFNELLKSKGVSADSVLFIGNDVPDVECMKAAGIGAAPSDAHKKALDAADFITKSPGGRGSVREICDLMLGG